MPIPDEGSEEETDYPCPMCSCEIVFDIDGYGDLTEWEKELVKNYPIPARIILQNKEKAE